MSARQYITVGSPKEIKKYEGRVGLTPSAAAEYVKRGHTVVIETNAGIVSGFSDSDYTRVGCKVVASARDVYNVSEMIVKVKEPQPQEYSLLRPKQLLFTFFHFAASEELTRKMVELDVVCFASETLEVNGSLPLLLPMSEVAGRMAVQVGAKLLETQMGGRGILLGGVPGVSRGNVLILGGGVVGTQAAKIAAAMGADVTVLDNNLTRLRYLAEILPANVTPIYSSHDNLTTRLASTDLVIGSVLIPGAKAPKLISRDMLKIMKKKSVIVDVAVDQGGCVETCKPTTHDDPTYEVEGVIHYCVGNMPGAVPHTSTLAYNNATLPFGLLLADKGWKQACKERPELKSGLNIAEGKVVYRPVAEAFNLPYTNVEHVLNT